MGRGVNFAADASCPKPVDETMCDGCTHLQTQEVCLGLCSAPCKWANVSLMRGDYCALRVLPKVAEDQTLIIVALSAGGALVLGGLIFLCPVRTHGEPQAAANAEYRHYEYLRGLVSRGTSYQRRLHGQ